MSTYQFILTEPAGAESYAELLRVDLETGNMYTGRVNTNSNCILWTKLVQEYQTDSRQEYP